MPFGPAVGGVLSAAFAVLTIVPSFAVTARRLHDSNRRAWWIMAPIAFFAGAFLALALSILAGWGGIALGIVLILSPFVGLLALFVLLCLQGSRGPNRFGPDPRDPASVADLTEVFR